MVPATQYGMSADFPLEMLVTVTFEEIGGKTKLTLSHIGIRLKDVEKELEQFFSSMIYLAPNWIWKLDNLC